MRSSAWQYNRVIVQFKTDWALQLLREQLRAAARCWACHDGLFWSGGGRIRMRVPRDQHVNSAIVERVDLHQSVNRILHGVPH